MQVVVKSALNGKEYRGEWNGKYYIHEDKFKGKLYKIYLDFEAVTITKEMLFELFDERAFIVFQREIMKEALVKVGELEDKFKCQFIQELLINMDFPDDVQNEVAWSLNAGHGYDDFVEDYNSKF